MRDEGRTGLGSYGSYGDQGFSDTIGAGEGFSSTIGAGEGFSPSMGVGGMGFSGSLQNEQGPQSLVDGDGNFVGISVNHPDGGMMTIGVDALNNWGEQLSETTGLSFGDALGLLGGLFGTISGNPLAAGRLGLSIAGLFGRNREAITEFRDMVTELTGLDADGFNDVYAQVTGETFDSVIAQNSGEEIAMDGDDTPWTGGTGNNNTDGGTGGTDNGTIGGTTGGNTPPRVNPGSGAIIPDIIPEGLRPGYGQFVDNSQMATDTYNKRADSLWQDYLDFENQYTQGYGDIRSEYRNNMDNIPSLNYQLPEAFGGGNIPMAPKVHAGMYRDRANTESDLLRSQANANLAGMSSRNSINNNMFNTNIQNANNALLPTNAGMDLYQMERAADLGLESMAYQDQLNEPSDWTRWAPVAGSILQSGIVDDLWEGISGIFS